MQAHYYYYFNGDFKIPIDPSNKLAISINFYEPSFAKMENEDYNTWGSENVYKLLIANFEDLKYYYTDKGIPIIFKEFGVLTELGKNESCIREYLYTLLSLISDNELISSCLWDTSNKNFGNMNYYNREIDKWYDEKIQEFFLKFSRDKQVK